MDYDVTAANRELACLKVALQQCTQERDPAKRSQAALRIGQKCQSFCYADARPVPPSGPRLIPSDVLDASSSASALAEQAYELFHEALQEQHPWFRSPRLGR